MDDQTRFLLSRGWKKTTEIETVHEHQVEVWKNPSGEKFTHSHLPFVWTSAYPQAVQDLFRDEGWREITLRRNFIEFETYQDCPLYLHPKSKKPYTYIEAEEIAVSGRGSERVLQYVCYLARQAADILKRQIVEPGDILVVNCVEGQLHHHRTYQFQEIIKTQPSMACA